MVPKFQWDVCLVLERRLWRTVEKCEGHMARDRCPLREAMAKVMMKETLSILLVVERSGEH